MGDDAEDDEGEEGGEEGGGKKKPLILIIVALVLVLFPGGGAVLYFTGLLDSLLGIEQAAPSPPDGAGQQDDPAADYAPMVDKDGNPLGPPLVDLPEFLINWETNGKRVAYLKLVVALEVATPADMATVAAARERLYEALTLWLRQQQPRDIEGAEGIFRLREEFFIRASEILQGTGVRDVVVRTILLQ